jgi:hypothetical protein
MVVIHLKKGEESLFLHNTPVTTPIAEIAPKLAKLHNDRKRLERLINGIVNLRILIFQQCSYQRLA